MWCCARASGRAVASLAGGGCNVQMACPEDLAALADKDLLGFLFSDDTHDTVDPGEENLLLEGWGLPGPKVSSAGIRRLLGLAPCLAEGFSPQLLNKEMDDFISHVLSPCENEPGPLQGCSSADSDSGISEDQNLFHSPGSDFASSPQSLDIVQFDHSYSLHQDWPALESMRADMAEGDVSIDFA